jgi:20S proteasome alpha/beta subunit
MVAPKWQLNRELSSGRPYVERLLWRTKLMSLIVTLKGQEDLVIASDSRTLIPATDFAMVNDSVQKVVPLTKRCAIGITGHHELGVFVRDRLRQQINDNMDVEIVLARLLELLQMHFPNDMPTTNIPTLILVLTGYPASGEPRIYVLDSSVHFAPRLVDEGFSCVGVFMYARVLAGWLYRPTLPTTGLIRLAAFLLSETIKVDAAVGGQIRVYQLPTGGDLKEIDATTIRTALSQTDRQREIFADSFISDGSIPSSLIE